MLLKLRPQQPSKKTAICFFNKSFYLGDLPSLDWHRHFSHFKLIAMRKLLLLFMLVPIISLSQTKNVISAFRVFPKNDKLLEFDKALKSHADKYHTGDWRWRVYEIQSGPDAGGFHVIEGPLSWEQLDKRGNLGEAHTADWAKLVAAITSERGAATYTVFDEELSNVALTDFADKILINHMYPRSGMVLQAEELIRKMKAVWVAGKESVAVYRSVGSGEPQFSTVHRLKSGLKELDASFRGPIKDRYNTANGANSWTDYLREYATSIEKRWSELLFYRPDLSSK